MLNSRSGKQARPRALTEICGAPERCTPLPPLPCHEIFSASAAALLCCLLLRKPCLNSALSSGSRSGQLLQGNTWLRDSVLEPLRSNFTAFPSPTRNPVEGMGELNVYAQPISETPPTSVDLVQSKSLEDYLKDQGLYESQEESLRREEVLGTLDRFAGPWPFALHTTPCCQHRPGTMFWQQCACRISYPLLLTSEPCLCSGW